VRSTAKRKSSSWHHTARQTQVADPSGQDDRGSLRTRAKWRDGRGGRRQARGISAVTRGDGQSIDLAVWNCRNAEVSIRQVRKPGKGGARADKSLITGVEVERFVMKRLTTRALS
jgi:hypothetical protein